MPETIASLSRKDDEIHYDAFISYSHAKDKPIAAVLQSVMQKLGKAWYQRRSLRVFRDDTSLAATPQLWPTIEHALAQSRYLIVLASPHLAASKWCAMEVAYWLEHKGIDTILVALTDGQLSWDDKSRDFHWSEATPLPQVMKGQFVHQPRWIDLASFREHPDSRDAKLIDASAGFAAAIRGLPKEDLLSQEVREQRRAVRLAWLAAAVLLILTGAATWEWAEAVAQRREAETQRADAIFQRDRAERNLEIARKTAEDLIYKIAEGLRFVEGMRIEAIQQILETARSTMDELLQSAPDDPRLQRMKSAMLDEFAKTYRAAGALDRALVAAEEALSIIRKLAATLGLQEVQRELAAALNRKAEILEDLGDHARALAAYEESRAITRALLARNPRDSDSQRIAGIAVTRIGDMRLKEGLLAEALAAYEEALDLMRKLGAADPRDPDRQRDLAISLNKVGEASLANRDEATALLKFEEGLAIRRRLVAANPLATDWQRDLSQSLIYVGRIYYRQGKKPRAFAAYEESLPIRRKLVSMNPGNLDWQRDLGVILGTLGELWLAEGVQSAPAAAVLLEECVTIMRNLVHVDPGSTFRYVDLARALFSLSGAVNVARGRTLLQEAITIMEKLDRENRLDAESGNFLRVLRDGLARFSQPRRR